MKTKSLVFLIPALALFAACSSDPADETATATSGVALNLYGVPHSQHTRASQLIQNTTFDRGSQVNVYITEDIPQGGSATVPAYPSPLVYIISNSTSGAMTPVTATYPYFPKENGVKIKAYYPSTVLQSTQTFEVQNPQTTDEQYKASDLMYAYAEADKNNPNVTLQFYHMLSKVNVRLVSGTNSPVLTNSTVTLLNIRRNASFTASSGAVSGATGQVENILMTKNGANACACIVPPQTLSGYIFQIVLPSGDNINYNMPGGIILESGKVYSFTITVNQHSISVSYSVEPWDQEETGWPVTDRPTF